MLRLLEPGGKTRGGKLRIDIADDIAQGQRSLHLRQVNRDIGGGAAFLDADGEAVGGRQAGHGIVDIGVGDQLLGCIVETAEGDAGGGSDVGRRCRRLQGEIVEVGGGEIALDLAEPRLEARIEAGELAGGLGRSLRQLGKIGEAVDRAIEREEFLIVLFGLGIGGRARGQRHVCGVEIIGGRQHLGGLLALVPAVGLPGRRSSLAVALLVWLAELVLMALEAATADGLAASWAW